MSVDENNGETTNGGKYTESSEFALWDKYETVAMHFNDLIIRLRTQALGGLTGIVALSGLALNFAQKPESRAQWVILFGTLVFFALAWIALWILDMGYYNKLLMGAVMAILDHEKLTLPINGSGDTRINLSTKISALVPANKKVVSIFYSLVLAGLGIGALFAGFEACTWEALPHQSVEYKVQLSHPDKVNVAVENVKPAGKP